MLSKNEALVLEVATEVNTTTGRFLLFDNRKMDIRTINPRHSVLKWVRKTQRESIKYKKCIFVLKRKVRREASVA